MEVKNILEINSKEEFYSWLRDNHKTENECWITCKKGRPIDNNVFYYIDAVYAAICFGWIDSVSLVVNGVRMQRFSPRVKKSNWTELNKERARWLIKKNLMTESGLKVLPDLNEEYKIEENILSILKEDEEVWKNFSSFPRLYKRIRISNILSKKPSKEHYTKALNHFIEETKKNKMFGEWNDGGRLA